VNGELTLYASAQVSGVLVIGTAGPVEPVLGGTTAIDVTVISPAVGTTLGRMILSGESIAMSGSTAYVAAGTLEVVDLRVPHRPTRIDNTGYDFVGSARCVKVQGTQLFIADDSGGVRLADVTNPAVPVLLSTYATPASALDLALGANGLVFVAGGQGGLQILDFSDPQMPVLRASLELQNGAHAIAYAPAGYLVVGSASNTQDGGEYGGTGSTEFSVTVIDVRSVDAPVVLRSISMSGEAARIAIRGNFAYVATRTGGLAVVDISDPSLPIIDAFLFDPSRPNDLAGSNDALVVAGGSGYEETLHVFNVAAGASLVRELDVVTEDNRVGRAVAAEGELALVIIDVWGWQYLAVVKFRNADGSL
jgi:hypothetical protein